MIQSIWFGEFIILVTLFLLAAFRRGVSDLFDMPMTWIALGVALLFHYGAAKTFKNGRAAVHITFAILIFVMVYIAPAIIFIDTGHKGY